MFYTEDLVGAGAGTYTLTVNDNGCISIMNIDISSILPNPQELCVVTVDSLERNNLIVWEKEISTSISHYNVYRETSWPSTFLFVDSVLYDDMSEFYDSIANPFIRSWRYKISTVDICGVESDLSTEHKTIHLTINQGLGGAYNLIWDDYEGFPFGTFYIYRHLNSTGWDLIDSLPSTLHSYTNVPPSNGGLWYAVTVNAPNACVPTSSAKANGGPYTQSVSNLEDDGIYAVNIKEASSNDNSIEVYPNPAHNFVIVKSEKYKVESIIITDISGRTIRNLGGFKNLLGLEKINISNLPKGIYIINVKTSNGISIHKLIKE